MKTFLCKRFPPEGKEVTPDECAKYRSLPSRDAHMPLTKRREIIAVGGDPDERMPAPCEHCKDWERLCKSVLEQPERVEETHPDVKAPSGPEEPGPTESKLDKKIKVCLECKLPKKICAKGICRTCYDKKRKRPGPHSLAKIPPSLQSPEAFLEAVSGLQKSQPASDHTITLDFTMFEELFAKLNEKANAKLRTLHNQIIWELRWVLKEAPNARAEDATRDDL